MISTRQNSLRESHGVVLDDRGGIRWRLWAPRHPSVELVILGGGGHETFAMHSCGQGFFEYRPAEPLKPVDGIRYAYRLPGIDPLLPDPASHWQPDGVHEPSAVFDPRLFRWSDTEWRGVRKDELAIYELHVGTFTPEGTLDAAIQRLPEVADLGVTAVELMPLAQFPGTRNWGYDGVHPSAVQNSYGGPHALQRFVDAAHRLGLGVILDVVYNHFGPEGAYFGLFAPYFTAHHHTPWGDAINYDGPDCDPVRAFIIESACRWIRDFHVDGLRLDAVQTIYDLGAQHILAELQESVQHTAEQCGRSVVVIAESNQNDMRLVRSPDRGGYGLDAVWADEFHHAMHAYLTGERNGYYEDFGEASQIVKACNDIFVLDGAYSRHKRRRYGMPVGDAPREQFVVCIQNHDQIGNRAHGERWAALVAPEVQRLAAAMMLVSPCTPLLFMGEEYGETNPFPFFCSFLDERLIEAVRAGRKREFEEFLQQIKGELPDAHDPRTFEQARLSWTWPRDSHAGGLRNLYRTLLHARRDWPPLRDRTTTQAHLLDEKSTVLVLRRGTAPQALIYANLTNSPQPLSVRPGYRPQLSTAERRFGGSREFLGDAQDLHPYEFLLLGDEGCPTLPN